MDYNSDEKDNDKVFCGILSHSRFILSLIGFWPDDKLQKTTKCRYRSYVLFSSSVILSLINCVIMFANSTDIEIFIANIFDASSMVITCFRLTWLIWRRNEVLELAKETGRLLAVKKNPEATRIMRVWHSRHAKVVKCLTGMYVVALILYFVAPILHSERRLPIGTNFPTDFYQLPWFHLIYFVDTFICVCAIIGVLSQDIFVTFFVCHLCGELSCIAMEMEKFGCHKNPPLIRSTLEKHVIAIAYGNKIRDLISTSFYLEMIVSMFCTLASAIVIFLSINSVITARASAVVGVYFLSVFMICFIGETLLQESRGLREAVTNSKWYRCDVRDRKAVQIILLQAQKPLELRVGTIAGMDLRGFSVFIFNLYSYLTVLREMIEGGQLN